MGDPTPGTPNRWLSGSDARDHRPVHAVWELTLACNLTCGHCGSRAGSKRPAEMTTRNAWTSYGSSASSAPARSP